MRGQLLPIYARIIAKDPRHGHSWNLACASKGQVISSYIMPLASSPLACVGTVPYHSDVIMPRVCIRLSLNRDPLR